MLLRIFANLDVGAVLLGCTFKACGEVHGVAHHGVVLTHGGTHVSCHDVARVDTDAHVHIVNDFRPFVAFASPFFTEVQQLVLHVHGGVAGALGVVR